MNLESKKNKIIYIYPPEGYENEKLFNMSNNILNRDDCMRPFYILREQFRSFGYDLRTTSLNTDKLIDCAGIIACRKPHKKKEYSLLKKYSDIKSIVLLLEPPTVAPSYYERSFHNIFKRILTMFDDMVDNKKYFKFYYPQSHLEMLKKTPDFAQKKLCVLIAGNKISSHPYEMYSERERMINFLEQNAPDECELYGNNWSKSIKIYKGAAFSKMDILQKYKFCICYENMKNQRGYVTEKIFDALLAGCIPVYKGATNIADFVDSSCFINRDAFKNEKELYLFLKNMTTEEHNAYILAIRKYLKSSKAQKFSADFFAESIVSYFIEKD